MKPLGVFLLLLSGCTDILSWMTYPSLNGIGYVAVEQAFFPDRTRPREESRAPLYDPDSLTPTRSLRQFFSSSRNLEDRGDLDFAVMYFDYVVGGEDVDWTSKQIRTAGKFFVGDGRNGRHAVPSDLADARKPGPYAYYAYIPVARDALDIGPGILPAHDLAAHPDSIQFRIGSPQIWIHGPKSNVVSVPRQDVIAALAGKSVDCTAHLPTQVPPRENGAKGRR